jgi:coproporphyrinogen III oxidase
MRPSFRLCYKACMLEETNAMVNPASVLEVRAYFIELQTRICGALTRADGAGVFSQESIASPNGGLAQPRVMADGRHIEKAAVQFSHSVGESLPPAATERNPQLAGHAFQATAISLIVHPVNPHVPTTHANLRFFYVDAEPAAWYFGGGYDLTPYYPWDADIVHWHETARHAAGEYYAELKAACDEYFYIGHRQECRGVGGLFFDDWSREGFDSSFAFVRRIGDSFLPAYLPIFEARKDEEYDEKEREFQLYRRGRYAEFNLAIDRGTRYGLQSGRRIESVLASLPPVVRWVYDYRPEAGSREARLTEYYLQPRDWLAEQSS